MSDCHCPLKAAAKEAPSSLAFISKEISLTYKELDSLADRFVCNAGSVIAAFHPPSHELIALFFAVWRSKASVCPLNTKLPPAQIQACLERIKPDLFISSFPLKMKNLTTEPTENTEKKVFSPFFSVFSVGSVVKNFQRERLSDNPIFQSLLLFTSGSTGIPKIAILTLKSLLANAANGIPLISSDRWLLSLPLYHVGGIGIMLRCVLAKAALVLDKSYPDITHMSLVPTQLYRASPVYKNLKCVLLGGAPIHTIPPSLPIYASYGLTEMGSMVLARKNPPIIDGHIYLGNPLPKREISIKSDGEICVKGETLFTRYLDEEKTNGWFATGDIGKLHPKEGIAIIGRKDWQFICGGENIQPEEIEQYLLQIPNIIEAVVVPKPDPEFGMVPVAVIQTETRQLSLAHIQHVLKDHLPKYKIPAQLYILDEIPKNGLKINRRKISRLIEKI